MVRASASQMLTAVKAASQRNKRGTRRAYRVALRDAWLDRDRRVNLCACVLDVLVFLVVACVSGLRCNADVRMRFRPISVAGSRSAEVSTD
eukprot:3517105-Prymnesium_polylepis.1